MGTAAIFPPLAQIEFPFFGIPDPDAPDAPAPGSPPPPRAPANTPGLANVTLTRSTVIGSAFTAPGSVSNVTLLDNSTWIMTGSSNVTNLVNDPSLIEFTAPTGDPLVLASYKTLTTVNYLGIGGLIGLNTYLGNDSSPSDRLVIDGGNASGNSPLRIRNTVGAGALTVANGILVVDAINGGTTAPGTFALADVSRPDLTTTRYSAAAWMPASPGMVSAIDARLHLDPTNPVAPRQHRAWHPDQLQSRQTSVRETSLYAAIPSMTLLYGRTLLDTLHERVGEEEDLRNRRTSQRRGELAPGAASSASAAITRATGSACSAMDRSSTTTSARSRPVRIRSGAIAPTAAGITRACTSRSARSRATSRMSTVPSAGTDRFNAYSLGGYWTHFGPTGWYLDAILQGTWYDAKGSFKPSADLTTNGCGFAGSSRAGYPIRLGSGFIIEPQAQFVYQNVNLGDGSDNAATVQFRNIESLRRPHRCTICTNLVAG